MDMRAHMLRDAMRCNTLACGVWCSFFLKYAFCNARALRVSQYAPTSASGG